MKAIDDTPDVSPGMGNPDLRLLGAVVHQAVLDFRSTDLLISMDALCFMVDPRGALMMLEQIGMDVDPADLLFRLVGGAYDASGRPTRTIIREHKRHEFPREGLVHKQASPRAARVHREDCRRDEDAGKRYPEEAEAR